MGDTLHLAVARRMARLLVRSLFLPAFVVSTFSCFVNQAWSQQSTTQRLTDGYGDGYVFINGEYVSPPYRMEWTNESLTINGRQLTTDSLDLSKYEVTEPVEFEGMRGRHRMSPGRQQGLGPRVRRTGFNGEGYRGPHHRTRSPFGGFFDEISGIENGMIAVLYEGHAPLCIDSLRGGHELLQSLTDSSKPTTAMSISLTKKSLATKGEVEVWNKLVSEFTPSKEFALRADQYISKVEAASAESERVIAGTFWIEKISYPLTVFAMALVVLGFGHLLSNRPHIEESEPTDWGKRRKVVGQSLLIVGLLSAVDLIWTIGTANAGLMRELNPLGSGLIGEPVLLFLFKAVVTATSIGILYWLHRRPVAQMASWWCCLLLTLLTARWVVFQSMFL